VKILGTIALTGALGFLVAGTAGAIPINFYASGAFTSSTGPIIGTISTTTPTVGDSYTNNTISYTTGSDTISIRYEDVATATALAFVNAPTSVGYGFFNLDASGLTSNGVVNIGQFTFDLTIHDITDGGIVIIHGSSSGGTIAQNSALVSVVWSPNTGVLGTTTWEVDTPTRLVPPNTTTGETTIQGQVTSTLIPEPASMFLMGTGLLAVAFASRRKFGQASK
jgi:hypothetical protein